MMKLLCFVLVLWLWSASVYAGAKTPDFSIVQITQWANGYVKIYTDQPSIDGLEGCTATDSSIALLPDSPGTDRVLAVALAGKTAGTKMHAYVVGCCLTQDDKQSPCVHTLTVK